MKNRLFFTILLQFLIAPLPLLAQATAFTYQGRLLDRNEPANGGYDLRFTLAATPTNGNYIGNPLEMAPIPVSNGLFTVTLDFGEGVFNGASRWLEIGVRTNGSSGAYTTLNPRQALMAAPHAIFANTASNAAVASSLVPGAAVVLNGAGITNLNGASIQAGTVNSNALDVGTRAQLALAGIGGESGLGNSITNGGNVSSLMWTTNTYSWSNFLYTTLTLTGCTNAGANGIYYARGTLANPSNMPPVESSFTWTNASGYQLIWDVALILDYFYVLYDPATNLLYGASGTDYSDWPNGSMEVLVYPTGAATGAKFTAPGGTNAVATSAYLTLRTDNTPTSLVVSNGGIVASSFAGDGTLVSNTVPNGYLGVLAAAGDTRVSQGAVFKQEFNAPPMGICTWPAFLTGISDSQVRELADALYTNHLVELGWKLIQLDGGWQGGTNWGAKDSGRDTNGLLAYNTSKFLDWTNTLKYLSDRGIALGLYHEMTKGNEGMVLKDHYEQDAAMLKAWGVRYMKIDEGSKRAEDRFAEFAAFRTAADAIDWHPFVMNGGLGPTNLNAQFPLVLNAGRMGLDGDLYIQDAHTPQQNLALLLNHFQHAMTFLSVFSGINRCKDMDFLTLSRLSDTNQMATALSLWAIGPSILMIDKITNSILPLITNKAFIAVHQDPYGIAGRQIATNADSEVWYRPLVDGARAVCVINKSPVSQTNTLALSSLGITPQPNEFWTVHSVWDNSVIGYVTNNVSVSVGRYRANLLMVTPNRPGATVFALPTTNTPPVGVISTLKTDGTHLYWKPD